MSGYLTDNPASTWVTNGVVAVTGTDLVEGMESGASHGGIGNSNAGAQVLANRTAFLYGRQNTNIANIATLLGFVSELSISESNPGYAKIPMQGGQTLILQWGQQNTTANSTTVNLPLEFPTECVAAWVNEGGAGTWFQGDTSYPTLYATQGLGKNSFSVLGLIWAGNSTPGWVGIGSGRTFNWLALGW